MSNAYIPDQLHHMSRKELLEFAQTAHDENVGLVRRVKELESHNVKLESYNLKLANESHEYQQRCGELEKELINHKNVNKNIHLKNTGIATLVSELTGNNVVLPKMKSRVEIKKALNKFALENQIKALEWFDENNLVEDETTTLLLERIEQLRKEQE
ncbi:MAG: hypothetical protein CL600_07875 [Alteromonas sp.]|nr:hypothetical protein [Alteromonas sp.]